MEHYHNEKDGLTHKLRLNVFAVEHAEVRLALTSLHLYSERQRVVLVASGRALHLRLC